MPKTPSMRAVLFDLDGTLLPLDTDRFIDAYVRRLAQWFARWMDPARFTAQLLVATQAMLQNRDPSRTNREVFAEAFYPALGTTEDAMAPRLAEFYLIEFPKLRPLASPDPAARRAVLAAIARGMDVVIATNPVFPETAVRQRMDWAGIGDLAFRLVTTYETSHYCKPHPEYFLEVAAAVACAPRDCLMVGNDVEEDAAARSVGMRTYLVTDHLVNRRGLEPNPDASGSLADLVGALEAFPRAGTA